MKGFMSTLQMDRSHVAKVARSNARNCRKQGDSASCRRWYRVASDALKQSNPPTEKEAS